MAPTVRAEDLFEFSDNGSVTPKRWLRVRGADISPGSTMRPPIVNGFDLNQLRGRQVSGHEEGRVFVLE